MPPLLQKASHEELVYVIVFCHEHMKTNGGTLLFGGRWLRLQSRMTVGRILLKSASDGGLQLRLANGLEEVGVDAQFPTTFHVPPARPGGEHHNCGGSRIVAGPNGLNQIKSILVGHVHVSNN